MKLVVFAVLYLILGAVISMMTSLFIHNGFPLQYMFYNECIAQYFPCTKGAFIDPYMLALNSILWSAILFGVVTLYKKITKKIKKIKK